MEIPGPGGDGTEADRLKLKLQNSIDAALNNYEVVKSICSATSSEKDLLNFRLVNTTFHYEATVRMRIVPAPVNLLSLESMVEFLKYLKTDRMDLVSPFSSIKLDVLLLGWSNVLEEFSTLASPNARHYIFDRKCYHDPSLDNAQVAHIMVVLLSCTPHVRSLGLYADHFLSAEDVALLPFLSELQILKIQYLGLPEDQLPGTTSLLSTLVTQPSPLKHVLIPSRNLQIRPLLSGYRFDDFANLPNMDILRLVVQNHKRLPTVSMGESYFDFDSLLNVRPETLHLFEELIRMNLTFRDLGIHLDCPYWVDRYAENPERNDAIGKKILNTVSELLHQQSARLICFGVHQMISADIGSLALPQFPHLKDLNLTINGSEILPLTPNQFPILQELTFFCSHEGYLETIGQVRLPYLEKVSLFLREPARFTSSWKTIIPNVSHLWLDTASVEELAVILTQFPQLLDLSVELDRNTGNYSNYWDILTGGAPRPVDTKTLLNAEIQIQILELMEPVQENDGSYRVPSLRNMKALKKLNFSLNGNPSQTRMTLLDPILYMTLAKFLVPLEELEIEWFTFEKELGVNLTEYEKILSDFHVNVKIADKYAYNGYAAQEEQEQDNDDLNNEDIEDNALMNQS